MKKFLIVVGILFAIGVFFVAYSAYEDNQKAEQAKIKVMQEQLAEQKMQAAEQKRQFDLGQAQVAEKSKQEQIAAQNKANSDKRTAQDKAIAEQKAADEKKLEDLKKKLESVKITTPTIEPTKLPDYEIPSFDIPSPEPIKTSPPPDISIPCKKSQDGKVTICPF